MRGRLTMAAALAVALVACKGQGRFAEVEGVMVPQADGLLPLPKGLESIKVDLKTDLSILPESQDVGLAIERYLRWSEVREARDAVLAVGKTPHLIVASNRKLGGIELQEELEGEAIEVFVTVEGKLCVGPPKSREKKCVQRGDRKHVDRAFTRELIREAVKVYGLHDVQIDMPPDIEWADVVRAVDGARTCCFDDKVRVRITR